MDFNRNKKSLSPPPGRAYRILEKGTRLKDFEIIRCISFDIFGTLYQARNHAKKEDCGLYLLPEMVQQDDHFKNQFRSKAKRLTEIDHPHILRFVDYVILDTFPGFITEAFDGQSLSDYLGAIDPTRPNAPINQAEVELHTGELKSIAIQTLGALAYAHQKDTLHLNLTPNNILRTQDGQFKVIGFGIISMIGLRVYETLVSAGIPPVSMGPRNIRLNTVDIQSPEVSLGNKPDKRTDIFAFGVSLYWLLSGLKPSANYRAPSALVPDLAQGWDIILARCLSRDPAKRYPTAMAMLKDVERVETLEADFEGKAKPPRKKLSDLFHPGRRVNLQKKKPEPKVLTPEERAQRRKKRLITGGVSALILAAMALVYMVFIREQPELPEPDITRVIVTPPDQSPRITLTSTNQNFRVVILPDNLEFNLIDGKLGLNMMPGEYIFKMFATDSVPEMARVIVGTEPDTLAFTLKPALGGVEVTGPPEATITLTENEVPDRTYTLKLDEAGKASLTDHIFVGTYTAVATKPDYRPSGPQTLRIRNRQTTPLAFQLAPLPATLRVTSIPENVQLIIEGELRGTTPLTVNELPAEKPLRLIANQDGYRPLETTVTLPPNGDVALTLPPLERKVGTLRVSLSVPGSAPDTDLSRRTQMTLTPLGDRPGKPFQHAPGMPVPEGDYLLNAEHPDFFPDSREIQIKDGLATEITFTLIARPARLQLGKINLEKTTITVNGVPTEANPQGVVELAPLRESRIEVAVRDHFTMVRDYKPGPNETLSWELDLRPLPPPTLGENTTVPYLGLEMNWIPPGTGTMGSPLREHARLPEEGPLTRIEVKQGFWMGRYEITQREYAKIMGSNPSQFRNPDHPVDSVSWDQAMAFGEALTRLEREAGRLPEGYVYRLPTEAEWEYAARAGTTTPFHFGEEASPAQGNFKGIYPRDFEQDISATTIYGPVKVGSYTPNAFGLYDMHGNVREWCYDGYSARLPGGTMESNRLISSDHRRSSLRGGGWESTARHVRSAYRSDGLKSSTQSNSVGFRIVLAPPVLE
jgi:formylglycine-generating enzyme required for sulfatase activity/serine/threonine protein kinase